MMSLCSIVRQSELINNIKNQVYVIDNNYNKYKRKIVELVHNHDTGALMKQLFWKPHVVLSIIVDFSGDDGNHFYPLFNEICEHFSDINPKLILFFLNCLFFHSFIMLAEGKNETNKFLKRYFNWGIPDRNQHFYGIPISSIVPSSTQSSIVNLILSKEYLNALAFNGINVCVVSIIVIVIVVGCHTLCIFCQWLR